MSSTSSDNIGDWWGAGLCFSSSTLLPTRGLSVAITALCCVLSVLPFLPQYAKFILRQSASGVSQVTLALVTLSTWLQLLNLVVLHYDQIAACVAEGQAGWRACDHSLTTLAYIATSLVAAAPLLPLALAYTPPGRRRDTGVRLLVCLLVALLATGTPVVVGLSLYGSCAPLAAYATVLGVSCALAYVFMYLPQIIVSIQTQSAGSLSYGFLALHILLGVASAVQKAEGTHERIVTWAPPLVANVMQVALIGLNLHYDARADRAADGEEAQPLGAGGPHDGYGATAGGDGGKQTQKDTEQASGDPQTGRPPVMFSRAWWERYL